MDISELESQNSTTLTKRTAKTDRDTQNTAENLTRQQIDKVQTE